MNIWLLGEMSAICDERGNIWFKATDVLEGINHLERQPIESAKTECSTHLLSTEFNINPMTYIGKRDVSDDDSDDSDDYRVISSDDDDDIDSDLSSESYYEYSTTKIGDAIWFPQAQFVVAGEIVPVEIGNIISDYVKEFQKCEASMGSITHRLRSLNYYSLIRPYDALVNTVQFATMFEDMKDILMSFRMLLLQTKTKCICLYRPSFYSTPKVSVKCNFQHGQHEIEFRADYDMYRRTSDFSVDLLDFRCNLKQQYPMYQFETMVDNRWSPVYLVVRQTSKHLNKLK